MLFLCWNRGLPQKFPGLMSGTVGWTPMSWIEWQHSRRDGALIGG